MPIAFSSEQHEPTIRDLHDTNANAPQLRLPRSPRTRFRSPSPQEQNSPLQRKKVSRPPPPPPPPPPCYDTEEDASSAEDDEARDNVSPLHDDPEASGTRKTDTSYGSDILYDEGDDTSDGETLGGETLDQIQDDDESERYAVKLCGYKLCSRKKTNWNRISSRVVRYAPCFWCMPRSETGITDRAILSRLNILCAFFAAGQIASFLFFVVITLAGGSIANRDPIAGRDETDALAPNLWSLIGSIYLVGILAVIIFTGTIATLRIIKQVRFTGSLRYMWFLLWVTPLEIFLVLSLFDYHRVSTVWIKQWWYVPVNAWFREKFCPTGTDRSKCVVPICGLPSFGLSSATYPYKGTGSKECIAGEAAWCNFFFDDTDCTDIRNDAQDEAERFIYLYLFLNFVWGTMLVCLLVLTINILEGIITKPIVQKSRESNVPGWLTFPIVWSVVAGFVLLFSPSSVLTIEEEAQYQWVGVMFLIIGGLFFLAALWGWFVSAFTIMNNRDKEMKRIGAFLFILTLVLTIAAVVVVIAAATAYTIYIVDVGLSTQERGKLACALDTVDSCSFCSSRSAGIGLVECPEWTTSDVTKVSRTQLKQSVALAVIFLIYAISALRFGFVLWKHINQYEIAYV